MHIFFGLERDLFFYIYISPANSSFVQKRDLDKQIFSKLEADIAIMLMGDLNGHINCDEHDFIINDSDKKNLIVFCQIITLLTVFMFWKILRCNKILIIMENQLLNSAVVTLSHLRILNGRTLGDSVGKATYFNYSDVTINDYCICSASFLKNIKILLFPSGWFWPQSIWSLSYYC